MQKYQNWMSEGTMEAPARCGAKEKVPTVSSAPSATASAPARLRAVRLFMGRLFMGRRFTEGAGESTGYCHLRVRELAIRTRERGKGGVTLGIPAFPVSRDKYASPFGALFLFLIRTGRGP
jgi:hypothetical protein